MTPQCGDQTHALRVADQLKKSASLDAAYAPRRCNLDPRPCGPCHVKHRSSGMSVGRVALRGCQGAV